MNRIEWNKWMNRAMGNELWRYITHLHLIFLLLCVVFIYKLYITSILSINKKKQTNNNKKKWKKTKPKTQTSSTFIIITTLTKLLSLINFLLLNSIENSCSFPHFHFDSDLEFFFSVVRQEYDDKKDFVSFIQIPNEWYDE